MAKLRLLKVVCQAYFVVDDEKVLTERIAEPVVVPAAEWPTYATTTFERQVKALQNEVE